jgi:hypothetical protein
MSITMWHLNKIPTNDVLAIVLIFLGTIITPPIWMVYGWLALGPFLLVTVAGLHLRRCHIFPSSKKVSSRAHGMQSKAEAWPDAPCYSRPFADREANDPGLDRDGGEW